MSYKVPFIKPDFPNLQQMSEDYMKILNANWYTNFGPFEREFAKQIAAYIGDGYYAATFSSATAALMASVLALLGKGDETKYVIMPSFTFAAGADVLIWCGYKPLFIDIEEESLQMDVTEATRVLNSTEYKGKVAGILFCNAFGVGTTNIDDWNKLAQQYDLPMVIDSAAGFGSLYSAGRKVGAEGTCEIFSFHATKPFAIGEGGATISRDPKLIENLMSIQNFGFEDRNATNLGFNGKLQEFNAAIGLRQLQRFDTILKDRRSVRMQYQTKLDPDKFLLQKNAENASLCFAAVLARDADKRDKYIQALKAAGVDAKTYYSPSLHKQDYFKDTAKTSPLPVTDLVDSSVMSLPIHDNMSQENVDLIINTLNAV